MWKSIFKKNKFFFIALIVFLVLVTFVDKNNLLDNWRLQRKIKELENQRGFYMEKIRQDSLVLESLNDPAFLERYAREKFYMKRPEEEIYVIR